MKCNSCGDTGLVLKRIVETASEYAFVCDCNKGQNGKFSPIIPHIGQYTSIRTKIQNQPAEDRPQHWTEKYD